MKIKITREDIFDMPHEDVISREIIDQRRWDTTRELTFKRNGKFYRVSYDSPSTECQDGQEYPEEEEAVEVFPVEKTIIVYEASSSSN